VSMGSAPVRMPVRCKDRTAETPVPPEEPTPPPARAGATPTMDPRFRSALMAKRKGRVAEAREILEGMLATDADHADALEVLGMLVSEDGDLDRAIELTKRLVDLQPQSIMAHANLSRFYMLKGDKETAEDWQGRARVLGWKEEVGRKAAAGGGGGLTDGVSPDLVEKQEHSVEEHPEDLMARMALAGSYRKLGMPVKAVSHLQKALAIQDTSAVYLALGKSLEEANMPQDAAEIYRRGVPLADQRGDLMPRNQMASRLQQIEKRGSDS
jgi:tetratricopeptide (TPR) repeat protein